MALRFHFSPFRRAANPGFDVQRAARKPTQKMREQLRRSMGQETWDLDAHVTPMDDGSAFYAVVVSVDHCPADKRDFDRCQDKVLKAFADSGLDRHMIYDGTDFGPVGPGVAPGECPQRGYHFYEREPGDRPLTMPQSVIDAERAGIEESLAAMQRRAATKGRLLALNPGPNSDADRVAFRARMFAQAALWGELHEELDIEFDEWDSLKEVAPEFTRRTGLPLLGGGSDRIVFDLGDGTVLKLPIGTGGVDANGNECATWLGRNWDVTPERGRDLTSRWLAPVQECDLGGEWLVMVKVEPIEEGDVPNLDWGSVADTELGELGVADTRGYMQWGRLPDGRVVLVDYATHGG